MAAPVVAKVFPGEIVQDALHSARILKVGMPACRQTNAGRSNLWPVRPGKGNRHQTITCNREGGLFFLGSPCPLNRLSFLGLDLLFLSLLFPGQSFRVLFTLVTHQASSLLIIFAAILATNDAIKQLNNTGTSKNEANVNAAG
jgi:hypothetical protein